MAISARAIAQHDRPREDVEKSARGRWRSGWTNPRSRVTPAAVRVSKTAQHRCVAGIEFGVFEPGAQDQPPTSFCLVLLPLAFGVGQPAAGDAGEAREAFVGLNTPAMRQFAPLVRCIYPAIRWD